MAPNGEEVLRCLAEELAEFEKLYKELVGNIQKY